MAKYLVWTDGSCLGNPGPGGWAVLIRGGSDEVKLSGGEKHTTNNRMELLGAISALEHLSAGANVVLYADSQYVRDGITKWIQGWRRKGWKTATGAPVKNVDLWTRLDAAVKLHSVDWVWVKGHATDEGNNLVDGAARAAALTFR